MPYVATNSMFAPFVNDVLFPRPSTVSTPSLFKCYLSSSRATKKLETSCIQRICLQSSWHREGTQISTKFHCLTHLSSKHFTIRYDPLHKFDDSLLIGRTKI